MTTTSTPNRPALLSTFTHLTSLDITDVTRSLIPLIGGEPTDHGLRLVAVSDVQDGSAIEVTLEDTIGVRRHFHLTAVEACDTWPDHDTDSGQWCPHSGGPRGPNRTCPSGCHDLFPTSPVLRQRSFGAPSHP